MTADIDAVLSWLRERPECRDAVEVIERLRAERDAFVLAKEAQIGRLEARAQEAEAERDRLREALDKDRLQAFLLAEERAVWLYGGCQGSEDSSMHATSAAMLAEALSALGESPVPDEPTAVGALRFRFNEDGSCDSQVFAPSHPTGEERTDG